MTKGDHLDDETIAAFLDGRMEARGREAAFDHLDGCASCRALVAAAGATVSDEDATTATAAGDASPAAHAPRLQRTRLGRFTIRAVLGAGGMGIVYAAHDPQLDRSVALKVLRPGSADVETRRRRLLREARAVAGLVHPNIVTIFEVGEADDQVFIAMELLRGKTLRQAAVGASIDDRLRWMLDAAHALEAAHAEKVVHRDVKPDNMFIVEATRRLKLLDFGIVKREYDDVPGDTDADVAPSSLETAVGRVIGTPRYMAPEQREGRPSDARTDQYAWAIVAFELFAQANPRELAPSEREQRLVDAGLSPALASAIVRAMSDAMTERWPSMHPIITELEQELRQPGMGERPRRSYALVAVIALVASGVLAAGVLSTRGHEPPRSAGLCSVGASRAFAVPADEVHLFEGGDASVLVGSVAPVEAGARPMMTLHVEHDGSLDAWSDPRMAMVSPRAFLATGEGGGRPAIVFGDGSSEKSTAIVMGVDHGDLATSTVEGQLVDFVSRAYGGASILAAAVEAAPPTQGYRVDVAIVGGLPDRALWRTVTRSEERLRRLDVAVSGERTAIAFQSPTELRVARLDRDLQRLGDVLVAAPASSAAALGWLDTTVVALYVEERGGRARLRSTLLSDSAHRFAEPREVIAEAPVGDELRLTSGANVPPMVVWVKADGTNSVLRAAPLRHDGTIDPASVVDVARAPSFRHVVAVPTPAGVAMAWLDPARMTHTARLSCRP